MIFKMATASPLYLSEQHRPLCLTVSLIFLQLLAQLEWPFERKESSFEDKEDKHYFSPVCLPPAVKARALLEGARCVSIRPVT